MSKITNDGLILVWHRMIYSCTHMATAGIKGLNRALQCVTQLLTCHKGLIIIVL